MSKQKYAVCPDCRGEGYVSNLGTFTSSDMDEWYGDDWDSRDEFVSEVNRRGGAYDRRCETCDGQNVVPACHCGEPLLFVVDSTPMSGCYDHLSKDEEEYLDSLRYSAMEQRMGC